MATKLIRLVNDKKKSLGSNPNNTSYMNINSSGKQMRDVETEEYVAELESKLSDLELQNKKLRENVNYLKKIYKLDIFYPYCFYFSFRLAKSNCKLCKLKKMQLAIFIVM